MWVCVTVCIALCICKWSCMCVCVCVQLQVSLWVCLKVYTGLCACAYRHVGMCMSNRVGCWIALTKWWNHLWMKIWYPTPHPQIHTHILEICQHYHWTQELKSISNQYLLICYPHAKTVRESKLAHYSINKLQLTSIIILLINYEIRWKIRKEEWSQSSHKFKERNISTWNIPIT